jgi:hypothetical protein
MEYFRGQIDPKSIRELADGNFVDDMRFQTARLVAISYICGFNAAFISYWGLFRKLKPYVGLPFTLAVYLVVRNITLKNCMDRIYYPI